MLVNMCTHADAVRERLAITEANRKIYPCLPVISHAPNNEVLGNQLYCGSISIIACTCSLIENWLVAGESSWWVKNNLVITIRPSALKLRQLCQLSQPRLLVQPVPNDCTSIIRLRTITCSQHFYQWQCDAFFFTAEKKGKTHYWRC